MKTLFWKTHVLVFSFLLFTGNYTLHAQEAPAKRYLQEAGDHALIYSGELEAIYNPFMYESTPYYIDQEYTPGEIYSRGNYYPDQQLRFDLHKDQVIVLSPQSNFGIILDPAHVDKVRMYDRTIIYHTPPGESGLKTGYYFLLHEGKELKLLGRSVMQLETHNNSARYNFHPVQRSYLLRDGIYHPVRNRKSFSKLFPAYKKEIKRFVKDNQLDFSLQKEESLTKLAQFCEKMIQTR